MAENHIRLTSAEIGGLWSTYMNSTMTRCLLIYFLHHIKDHEMKDMLQNTLDSTNSQIQRLNSIFSQEKLPIPNGFTDKDIDLTAPPLFYDPFALSFLYNLARMDMIFYSFTLVNLSRTDMIAFFTDSLQGASKLYGDSTALMLSKGLYDRPPNIPYPTEVNYIETSSYISGLLHKDRPLNVSELTEIFYNIERNYFSILLCTGLLQVVTDKEIKNYIKKGKDISLKQINFFNDLLKDEDLLGIVSVNMEVTDSKISPFSEKLIMNLFNSLNAIDITLIGHALSGSLRTDLSGEYSKLIGEILLYLKKGFKLAVERKWLEEPPSVPNRKKLEK
ncbi:DUF3231 family protein [Heyndrickxia sporothermodurans]|uniref:DUF3231 family protein n=1 Tax=Heyndrickxia sporothermodurans TaxID=46224 RepID=UPI002DB813D4|nr:DUF3231 family protein [Heyndrickxia sporothermodurans]MEB6550420.1 DUF3231 family protein [Heyndrickxia sporothermodurans]